MKFNPAKDIPDLAGKTVVVTGGNAGLGAATVRAVAAHNPANLFLCARTPAKADAFIEELRKTHPKTTTKPIQLDLASFDSIKAAAKQLNESCDSIDVLILNAGVAAVPAATTKDGYEITFGTNHVGHALFTQLLMSKVLAATKKPDHDTRIVVISSEAAYNFQNKEKGIFFDELKTAMSNRSDMLRYGHSKLANIYFAQALAKQYPSVTSVAVHPGLVFTEIWDKATAMAWAIPLLKPVVWLFGQTADGGATNQLWAGFGKGVQSGLYYEPVAKAVKGSANMQSTDLRDRLWTWTNDELAAHGGPGWPAAA